MTSKQAVTIASRAFALYLFIWALEAISYIPTEVFSLSHHTAQESVLAGTNYFRQLDVLYIALRAIRVVALLLASAWFYKCGPKVKRFFLAEEVRASESGHVNQ